MSLEQLTETEKRQLNLGNLVAQMLNDPKLSKDTKKLLKTAKPELLFPELDQEELIEKVRLESKEQADRLQAELSRRDAIAALEKENRRIEEVGLDAKAVREFMEKKGITDVEVVIELFESRQRLAEPSSDISGGPFRFKDVTQDELKAMWSNPQKWRDEKAYEVLKELRTGRRAV